MKIACIGEAMIEVALTGQTGAAQVGFAGDVLNTAIYLRRALPVVHEVAFVSMIGRDSLSDQMATFIAAEGISIAHLSRHPTLVPGLYTIATDALGERSFAYWRDTSAAEIRKACMRTGSSAISTCRCTPPTVPCCAHAWPWHTCLTRSRARPNVGQHWRSATLMPPGRRCGNLT